MTDAADREENAGRSRGLIVAAVFVGFLVLLGVVLAVMNGTRGPESASGSNTNTGGAVEAGPSESSTDDRGTSKSVCGLSGSKDSGTVSKAPRAVWKYDTLNVAYPVNDQFGPGRIEETARTCFQRSPEGAVFAAANAATQGSTSTAEWADYFTSKKAPNRDALVSNATGSHGGAADVRARVAGFRVLSYQGTSARVEVALEVSGRGQTAYASAVYELVWEDGDWRWLPTNADQPLRVAQLPDLAGFISWGA